MSEHDWKVHIPARQTSKTDKQEVIRVSTESYNVLVEIYNESTLTIKELASILILEASKRVVYDKEEN